MKYEIVDLREELQEDTSAIKQIHKMIAEAFLCRMNNPLYIIYTPVQQTDLSLVQYPACDSPSPAHLALLWQTPARPPALQGLPRSRAGRNGRLVSTGGLKSHFGRRKLNNREGRTLQYQDL